MPHYRYNATNSQGKWIAGESDGSNRDEVVARLLAEGLHVESLIEADPEPTNRPKVVSRDELVEMVEQLATLTRSGLPLPSGLRAAGREMISPTLRSTFIELADRLESGVNLDEALGATGRRFPVHLRGLILAGTRSGRLADMLGEYVRTANLAAELRWICWLNLAYPLIGLGLVLGLVGFICGMSLQVVQSLVGTMNNFGSAQLRSSNVEVILSIGQLISDHGLEILGGMFLVPIMIGISLRFLLNPSARRRFLCSIPILGPILRFVALTEFCHLLAMLIEAEMPLPVAFELAGGSVRDAEVAEACQRMGQAVEGGEPLSTAVRLWDSIPAGLGQLFQWSETQQNLPESLHLAGDMFEARARSQSNFAIISLAIFLKLLILWWIGFAIASMYYPMFWMIRLLSMLSG